MKECTTIMKANVRIDVITPGGGQRIAHFEDHFCGMKMNLLIAFTDMRKLFHHFMDPQKINTQGGETM